MHYAYFHAAMKGAKEYLDYRFEVAAYARRVLDAAFGEGSVKGETVYHQVMNDNPIFEEWDVAYNRSPDEEVKRNIRLQ